MILKVLSALKSHRSASSLIVAALISTLALTPGRESLAAEVASVDSAVVDLSNFEGHWQRIESTEADAARESSIEKAIAGLSWIVRTMASGVLKRTTAPPPEMQFAWDGARLHQGLPSDDGGFSRIIELDGELITRKDNRGVDFASCWKWTDGGLRFQWEQHQAEGNNFYRIDENAETLIVQHTIRVTGISNVDPIVFVSRFGRTDLPARAAAGLDHVARAAID